MFGVELAHHQLDVVTEDGARSANAARDGFIQAGDEEAAAGINDAAARAQHAGRASRRAAIGRGCPVGAVGAVGAHSFGPVVTTTHRASWSVLGRAASTSVSESASIARGSMCLVPVVSHSA